MCGILGIGGKGFFLHINALRIDLPEAEMNEGTTLRPLRFECIDTRDTRASGLGAASGRNLCRVPAVDGKAGLNGREVCGVYSVSKSIPSFIPYDGVLEVTFMCRSELSPSALTLRERSPERPSSRLEYNVSSSEANAADSGMG